MEHLQSLPKVEHKQENEVTLSSVGLDTYFVLFRVIRGSYFTRRIKSLND